jgi:hypothetical protein
MDWSKAKTILIVAFIITNIFLGYNVWETKYQAYKDKNISRDKVGEILSALEARGIEIGFPLPKDTYMQGTMTVEYMEVDPGTLAFKVFDGREIYPVEKGDLIRYVDTERVLEIINRREIFYTDLGAGRKPVAMPDEQQAVKKAEEFLSRLGLYRSEMQLDKVVPTELGYSLKYVQRYNDKLVEISIVEMDVTQRGIYSMHMLWLNTVKVDGGKKRVIPSVEALIKVVNSKGVLKEAPVVIESMDLVHYFDWEDAKEGEALPAWKVCIDGRHYYVNALTGQFN